MVEVEIQRDELFFQEKTWILWLLRVVSFVLFCFGMVSAVVFMILLFTNMNSLRLVIGFLAVVLCLSSVAGLVIESKLVKKYIQEERPIVFRNYIVLYSPRELLEKIEGIPMRDAVKLNNCRVIDSDVELSYI